MFGIGLPEMIVIFAVALIVVGPDKLPGLARSLAKGLMEMKSTLNQVKHNLTQEGEALDSVQQDLRKTADELKEKMIEADPASWRPASSGPAGKNPSDARLDLEAMAIAAEEGDEDHEPASAAAGESAAVAEGQAAQPPDAPPLDDQGRTSASTPHDRSA